MTRAVLFFFITVTAVQPGNLAVDADSDCFYTPYDSAAAGRRYPALVYLSCTGATRADLDSLRWVADSLGLVLSACHQSRNHQDLSFNDFDIMITYEKLIRDYPVDRRRIFIYGFSGQAVQALYTVFRHPAQFRGAFAVCGHEGAMAQACMSEMNDNLFYLMSRQEDWNLKANHRIYNQFLTSGVRATLFIAPGSHGPPAVTDFRRALVWLLENSE